MEKRYQVFISSTYADLQEERQQLIMALLELDAIPSGMELFPASEDDSWTVIRRVIEECDYYVVVVGGRYGSIGPAGISYTEMEYDYAVELGKPVMGFLHENPGSLPQGKCEDNDKGRAMLDQFRKKVRQRNCKFYTNPQDLGGKVSRSFSKLQRSHPATGWIRADQAASPELLAQVVKLREENDVLKGKLEKLRVSPPAGAASLSQGDDKFSMKVRGSWGSKDYIVEKSWNQIFSDAAPYLMTGINERMFRVALCGSNPFDDTDSDSVDEHDFQTIKVQFIALGLIEGKGDRTWSLTPLGRSTMVRLRAIHRDQ